MTRKYIVSIFFPCWGNCALYKAFHGSFDMIKPGKTVISEMLGANSKTAGWVEVLVMRGHESLSTLWNNATGRRIMERNSFSRVCTDEFSSNFDRIRKKKLQKPFRNSLAPCLISQIVFAVLIGWGHFPSSPSFLICSRQCLNFVMAGGRSQKLSLNSSHFSCT